MIRSLFHVPIITTNYNVDYTRKSIKCIIHWRNPANNNIQKSIGIARCNPNDTWNEILGKRIAESRAKLNIWYTYNENIRIIANNLIAKHTLLIENELDHLDILLGKQ